MLLTRFIISGHSMEPNLFSGDTVLVSNLPFLFPSPKIGDIVAFRKNDKIFIKRIAKINGEKYFVKGDNIKDSLDSRKIGWILKKEIVGKVIFKLA